MIKAIIVEDELIIRNALQRHIPWNDLGIGMVETAENAEEALKICEEYQPDIVVSDIMMRDMNGVAMCRELRKMYPECQLIYISGYSDKEYLKAAIELSAVDYVEKPIAPPVLIEAIKKALGVVRRLKEENEVKNHLEENRFNIKSKVLHSLIMADDSDENLDKNIIHSNLFSEDTNNMRICLMHASGKITNFRRLKPELDLKLQEVCSNDPFGYYFQMLDDFNIVLLLCSRDGLLEKEGPMMQKISEGIITTSFQFLEFYLAIGDIRLTPRELAGSYQSALNSLKCLSFKGYRKYSYADEPFTDRHFKYGEEQLEKLSFALSSQAMEEVSQILEDTYESFIKEQALLNNSVRNIYYNLDHCIIKVEKNMLSLKQEDIDQIMENSSKQIDSAMTFMELHNYVTKHAESVFNKSRLVAQNNSAVRQLLDIIHNEFGNADLSVNYLAERVFLTPTYLSTLFKKDIGVPIGQYMSNYRMEKAKQLLKDKRYKLYQISNLVGCSDSNYFAKIFKRQIGVTPSEYRENNLQ